MDNPKTSHCLVSEIVHICNIIIYVVITNYSVVVVVIVVILLTRAV